jgi:hypothetical protein
VSEIEMPSSVPCHSRLASSLQALAQASIRHSEGGELTTLSEATITRAYVSLKNPRLCALQMPTAPQRDATHIGLSSMPAFLPAVLTHNPVHS